MFSASNNWYIVETARGKKIICSSENKLFAVAKTVDEDATSVSLQWQRHKIEAVLPAAAATSFVFLQKQL